MQVNIKFDGLVSLPDTLWDVLTGTCFIDGIALPGSSDFRSAAVVGGPDLNKGMGVIAYHINNNTNPPSGQYEVHTPPTGSDWPNQASVQAVCGVAGGMVAFASSDSGVPYIQVNNTPLVAPDQWNTVKTMAFSKNYGTVQAMLEQDGQIYGFIKGASENYFFSADMGAPAYQYPNVWSYSGAAALNFYPPPQVIGVPNWLMTRRVALYNNRLYALDESQANVVSVSLDGINMASFPLVKSDTGGLIMDDKSHKAYCLYTGSHGYVMPYTVSDSGFARGPDTLKSGAGVCPSLDEGLGLLYLIGAPFGYNTILDVTTDSAATLTGDLLPFGTAVAGQTSTWADPVDHILYISGIAGDNKSPANVLAYKMSVTV